LPCEEIKYELIVELIDIIKNNYAKISEYFKDENKIKLARKVILSNIELIKDELRDLRLIELLGIDNKSKSMIMY
jgi:Ser-tRNA(Ala) deacylase AlaX